MEMEQKITEYLKQEFKPLALILHGSRARGLAKAKSDWDVFVVVNKEPETKIHGMEFEGEMLDVEIIISPLNDEKIKKEYILYLRDGKILFDTDTIGQTFINKAKVFALEGINLTEEEIHDRRHWLIRCLRRLEETTDNEPLFQYRLWRDFFGRATKYWYEILRNSYEYPPYIALPEIKEKDREYYDLIEILWKSSDNKLKFEAAQKIYKRIFP